MKIGDMAIFDGNDEYSPGLNNMYRGDTCRILEMRTAPFNDCCIAFDSFPPCNHRDYHNRFYVYTENMKIL